MKQNDDPLDAFFNDTTPEQMASDPILQQAFTVALLASDLYLPVEESETEQKDKGSVSLMAIGIEDQPHVMVFTSEKRLEGFLPTGTRFAKAPGNSVLPSLNGHFAVLNPGPDGRVMTPSDIAKITGQSTAQHQDQCAAPGHVHGPDCQH